MRQTLKSSALLASLLMGVISAGTSHAEEGDAVVKTKKVKKTVVTVESTTDETARLAATSAASAANDASTLANQAKVKATQLALEFAQAKLETAAAKQKAVEALAKAEEAAEAAAKANIMAEGKGSAAEDCNGCSVKKLALGTMKDLGQAALDAFGGIRVLPGKTTTTTASGIASQTEAAPSTVIYTGANLGLGGSDDEGRLFLNSGLGAVKLEMIGPGGILRLNTGPAALPAPTANELLYKKLVKPHTKWSGGQVAGLVLGIVIPVVAAAAILGVCFGAQNADGSSVCSSQNTTETTRSDTNTIIRF